MPGYTWAPSLPTSLNLHHLLEEVVHDSEDDPSACSIFTVLGGLLNRGPLQQRPARPYCRIVNQLADASYGTICVMPRAVWWAPPQPLLSLAPLCATKALGPGAGLAGLLLSDRGPRTARAGRTGQRPLRGVVARSRHRPGRGMSSAREILAIVCFSLSKERCWCIHLGKRSLFRSHSACGANHTCTFHHPP